MGDKNTDPKLDLSQDSSPAGNEPKDSNPPKDPIVDSKKEPTEKVFTQSQVEALLQKARSDEKKKVYPELDKLKKSREESTKKIQLLEEDLKTKQSEIEGIRSGKVAEVDSINRELTELREQNKKLETSIEKVVNDAAERIRQSDLAAFREKHIREAKLKHLASYVSGNDEEEILKSIEIAKVSEAKILEDAKANARTELSGDLPKPLAPDGSQGKNYDIISPKDRAAVARKNSGEYQKIRAQLLKQASS